MRCIADAAQSPSQESIYFKVSENLYLRNFHPADVPRVAQITAEALNEHYDPSLYLSLSREWPEGYIVGVDRDGAVQGFLLGVSQIPGEGRVLMFAVEGAWRRRGVGSALMSTFFNRCRVKGLRRVTLEVRVGNANAIRFYNRFGFTMADLLRNYYSDGENGYQMARYL